MPLFLQRLHERVEIERIIQVRLLLVLTQIRVPIIREGLLVHELQVIHIDMLSGKMCLVHMKISWIYVLGLELIKTAKMRVECVTEGI